ncbi:unnamed protein product [Didymodactylos carnosus]|uniref:Uncharacterized protein n=1 Tax=Didymodactylos carnosus TaxID=1234261 RepID=A0A813QIM4_9BILA|nr:unnamed protein product [Didymodactylos carnosus]CAF0949548.1 unnamed protein product [Didymodactylos carnosus]CAF3549090.1 unnamed protein product [Didymodactylos carnosus]CAF3723962.1 unnamed protein product [Didymodactylos carnosus]
MSSASALITSLEDIAKNPKLDHYDEQLCKEIHQKLDKEAKEQDMSYTERFEMAKKNLFTHSKWAEIFPAGVAQCLKEYWKERSSSAPLDPRFPNSNQTKRCWVNYVDYHRCMDVKQDEKICGYFKHLYKDLCPHSWVERWDEELEKGVFPGINN